MTCFTNSIYQLMKNRNNFFVDYEMNEFNQTRRELIYTFKKGIN